MAKNISKIIILAWLALQPFIFSCGSEAEKIQGKKEVLAKDSNHKYNEFVDTARKDSFLIIKDGQLIKKIELGREADSLLKMLKHKLSKYDSVGIDSLGRTIYVHKNDFRSLRR